MADTAEPTRYTRIQQLLDAAAGQSAADYDGHGRFWHLPVKDLETVSLGGVRMIAPEGTPEASPSCCCSVSGEDPAASPTCAGRGAASGLVKGLRGEAPFDGTRFPRLPWGGTPLAAEDVAFIEAWIDDGLPDDRSVLDAALDGLTATPTLEPIEADNVEAVLTETFGPYDGSPNEYKYLKGELKQRLNIDCMTEDQIETLRAAFRELYALNKWPEDSRNYNNLALVHQNHCQHGWERFLPWHRIYLYQVEQALQDIDPSVTMPYWDFTMPQYRPNRPETGWIIPPALQAFLTPDSIRHLTEVYQPELPEDEAEKLAPLVVQPTDSPAERRAKSFTSLDRFFRAAAHAGLDTTYTQGAYRDRFVDAFLASNALWYPIRYPGEYQTSEGTPSTINKVIQYHYPRPDDIEQILSLRSFRDFGGGSLYNDSFGFIDQNPHNTMHIWTGGMNPNAASVPADTLEDVAYQRNRGVQVAGRQFHSREDMYQQPVFGDMFSNLTAAFDPVFWPIHANIDRLWHEWQQRHPNSPPIDLDSVLTPWSYTIADTLDMHRFGYEYVKMTYLVPVGLAAPVGRFTSKPVDLPEAVRNQFGKAEVRLHRVPQLPRSCFIRVFVNCPDATAQTPLDHPSYAGYLAIFGHGPCYGGPGHCDLPPQRNRPFDSRPRTHNTPRNHRVDVSACVRRLVEKGATSLQITLVVIGADYEEDHEVLKLDGVSLNILD